jgi:glycosyltransferase involved in cell wall biosynthesis
VLVHDFAGHPFQVQLARRLARDGEQVVHAYCPSVQTPQGAVGGSDGSFTSRPVDLGRSFSKYSTVRRFVDEIDYGVRLARLIIELRPRVVISANTPLLAAAIVHLVLAVLRIPVVFWQQDVYSVALQQYLRPRARPIGPLLGAAFVRLERLLTRSSDHVVAISNDFVPILRQWGVRPDRITVIENWAPLDEVDVRSRPNPWSQRHGIGDEVVLLYAGTLGLKHDPSMLLALARSFRGRADVRVVVASEGMGADWLRENSQPGELTLLPFQDYVDLPDMLGSGDVLLVLLEPDAGVFSVPSKVLTYHCAGRPILGALPHDNLAARTIVGNGSGLVVEPGDRDGFVDAASMLVDDAQRRRAMAAAARDYAERTFDIDRIAGEFDRILRDVSVGGRTIEPTEATC